jgi:hypothetical protein
VAYCPALPLYCQVAGSPAGIEGFFVVLDEALLAKLRHCFDLLVHHQLTSLTFILPDARWLSLDGAVQCGPTAVEIWGCDHDHELRFTSSLKLTGEVAASGWTTVDANWALPVPPGQLSIAGLTNCVDVNGWLLGELDFRDSPTGLASRARFMSAIARHGLMSLVKTRQTVKSVVCLWDEVIPVVGYPADLLYLQKVLADLERMASHCLDLADLAALFQTDEGAWHRLRVRRIAQDASVSEAMADVQVSAPDAADWWFLFPSLESGKRINHAIKALLPPSHRCLTIPVVQNSREDSGRLDIMVIIKDQL